MSNNSWKLDTISDDPNPESHLFGFDKKSDEIVNFLTSKNTITPFVMSIDGEWGSGKSSLLLTTKKKLEKIIESKSMKMQVVYFDAWKYENSDPAAALVYNMMAPIQSKKAASALRIAKLAIDVVSRKALNMSYADMKSHFDESINAINTMEVHMRKTLDDSLPDGRLIVLIDDLDRCSIDNILSILNSLKLFLSLKNCLFIVAVDMKKVELAWRTQYGTEEDIKKEGTSYLEKIFQIRTYVPPKTEEDLETYIKNLVEGIPYELARILAYAGPKNLRKIKRLLNLASFLSSVGESKFLKYELSIIWVLFEHLMHSNERAMTVYREMPKQNGYSFLKWIGENVTVDVQADCTKQLKDNRAFQIAKGVPSVNDEKMWVFFRQAKAVVIKNRDAYAQLENSLDEIVRASEASVE